jgi:serine protease Do
VSDSPRTARATAAIPIAKALRIAQEIHSRKSSATVHVGGTAFLGVEVEGSPAAEGATIVGIVPGGPASAAGLVPGEVWSPLAGGLLSGSTGAAKRGGPAPAS